MHAFVFNKSIRSRRAGHVSVWLSDFCLRVCVSVDVSDCVAVSVHRCIPGREHGIKKKNRTYEYVIFNPQTLTSKHGRQLEHLIKLRTKGEEVLSTRLKHAQDDCERAIEVVL
jgi:hypothetical protein